jgi:hypothetical protein
MSLCGTLNWAVNKFADTELGDLRCTKRLVQLAPSWPTISGLLCPQLTVTAPCSKTPIASLATDIEP